MFIVLACLCLPPLIIGGLVKAGYYTVVTWRVWPWYKPWHLQRGNFYFEDDRRVPCYAMTAFKYGIAIYRPQDVPLPIKYVRITVRVEDRRGHGLSEARLEVYALTGQTVDDPSQTVFVEFDGTATRDVPGPGAYDVVCIRHGYQPIKKRVIVGPNGAFVKFVLPRALHGGVRSHRLPAAARS